MAEKVFAKEDPLALTGMALDLSKEEARRAEEEMAECFVEEYMRIGHGDEDILALFQNPFYRATHAILKSRGEGFVRELIGGVRRGERPQGEKTNG